MADGGMCVGEFDIRQIADALRRHKSVVEKRAARESWPFREQAVRGGKRRLYPLKTLPSDVQTALVLATTPRLVANETPPVCRQEKTRLTDAQIKAAWQRYEAVPQHVKDVAERRLKALAAVDHLVAEGYGLINARTLVSTQLQREGMRGSSLDSLGRWAAAVARADKTHRKALLVPDYVGSTASVEFPAEAWDTFKGDYLRPEAPTATSCYERLQRVARIKGWQLPSLRSFERKINREFSRGVLIMARKGQEEFDKTFPAQERDRSVFHALEAVNADGHKFDVFVKWPDGTIARPVMVGVQDLYSGKLLGWRIADTESSDLARLAFRDVIQRYGVPRRILLDNGRGFASKLLTGGVANRFRFKVKAEDPTGVLVGMGCEIRWATPYHGQAKPIERAWRDLCDRASKHPRFAGAYTGNNPTAKPENYGSKAVPLDVFVATVNEEIAAHNARPGRDTRVCGRTLSFDQAFNASYAQATISKATAEQLREMLLAAEVVTAEARDGSVKLSGNRYWSEQLSAHAGRKVTLRFDPESLHTSVHAYTLANVYIGEAECIAAVGFADTNAAREHARAKKQFRRAARQQLDAERRMDVASVAAQLPEIAPEHLPEPGVIAPFFGKARPPAKPVEEQLQRTGTDDAREASFGDLMERLQAKKNAELGFVPQEAES